MTFLTHLDSLPPPLRPSGSSKRAFPISSPVAATLLACTIILVASRSVSQAISILLTLNVSPK